jgi:phosphoribosyl 1,2-cyclic phosphodiesterase
MPVQFTVLASGSRGNSVQIRGAGPSLLIDAGLGPKATAGRLAAVGERISDIGAVVLTHTHSDHLQGSMLAYMARQGIPLYCHEGHQNQLARLAGYLPLWQANLVRFFDDRPLLLPNGMQVEPVALKHDGGPTFGFRIEARADRRSRAASIGYLADTGCWWDAMADAFTDVNLLGVEFNHDVPMQLNSGRSPHLIGRVLGDRGHLSNEQGAKFLGAVLERSGNGTLKDVVLLHLSEQCNCPDLATETARSAIRVAKRRISVHAAKQGTAHPHLSVRPSSKRVRSILAAQSAFPWERTAV